MSKELSKMFFLSSSTICSLVFSFWEKISKKSKMQKVQKIIETGPSGPGLVHTSFFYLDYKPFGATVRAPLILLQLKFKRSIESISISIKINFPDG